MIVKKKGFRTKCDKGKKWYFLKVHYDKNYMGQIMIKDPIKDIPKIIKVLKEAKKEHKEFLEATT